MWKCRGLTHIGNYKLSNHSPSQNLYLKPPLFMFRMISYKQPTKNCLISYKKGKDKIKRLTLVNDIEYGGLKMLDLKSMILAQKTVCLKKYTEDYASPWRTFLSYYLEKGGKFILQCHFDCRKLPVSMPTFY